MFEPPSSESPTVCCQIILITTLPIRDGLSKRPFAAVSSSNTNTRSTTDVGHPSTSAGRTLRLQPAVASKRRSGVHFG
jgi:hypothetical protein